MKRMIGLIMACLLLSGCSFLQGYHPTAPENNNSTLGEFGDALDSYDEYEKFCRNPDVVMPESFIKYEQIQQLGQFEQLYFLGNDQSNGDHLVDVYTYTLVDVNNRQFAISGFRNVQLRSSEKTAKITPQDMRSISDESREVRVFTQGNLSYYYNQSHNVGKLCVIHFEVKGVSYRLTADAGFAEFEPNPEGTFVERLLCLESAPAAVEEFEQMISIPYEPDTNTSH